MNTPDYDLCVIGGGINGVGIARDAAGRGLSVLLVEARDLASATSSASTKLIHGGLRYLEYFEFGLVRESLKEREILLKSAPHLVRPMEFVLPHDTGQRPFWMVRLGLLLYDHLAGRQNLKKSKCIKLGDHIYGVALRDIYKRAFTYFDCQTDDARLVVLNAMDAAERGASILTNTACTRLRNEGERWIVSLRDMKEGRDWEINAAMVVNAAGPWVRGVLEASNLADEKMRVPGLRLVKGSHIVVPRRFEGEHAYLLQRKDRRVVFAIPYERDFTLVGTTEEEYEGDPAEVKISDREINYLCAAYNEYFKNPVSADDIVWSYSGVRPLFNDGRKNATAATRGYKLYHHKKIPAPLLSVFGGKLTTYRKLAEDAVDKILDISGKPGAAWTCAHPLPGGDIDDFESFVERQIGRYQWASPEMVLRYARSYGTRMDMILSGARSTADLGQDFGDDVFEAEIVYLIRNEWARTEDDILWRRSKQALHVQPRTARAIKHHLPDLIKEHVEQ